MIDASYSIVFELQNYICIEKILNIQFYFLIKRIYIIIQHKLLFIFKKYEIE